MSHYYAKFKENPCVGTDASTPLQYSVAKQPLMPPHRHLQSKTIELLFIQILSLILAQVVHNKIKSLIQFLKCKTNMFHSIVCSDQYEIKSKLTDDSFPCLFYLFH